MSGYVNSVKRDKGVGWGWSGFTVLFMFCWTYVEL